MWHHSLLSSLTCPQGTGTDGVRLERLSVPRIDPSALSYISLFHRLQTLQLSVRQSEGQQQHGRVFDLLTSLTSSSPLPPLRHLQMHLQLPEMGEDRCRFDWCSRLFDVLPAFIRAYAGQLLTLDLYLSRDQAIVDELQPILISTAQAMTSALLLCHSLRRLRIADWWLSPTPLSPPSPSPHPSLPHLEAFHLDVVAGIDEATLATLLDASPHLLELTLSGSPFPYDILPWIGDRCHELRSILMADSQTNNSIDQYPTLITPNAGLLLHHPLPYLS